MKRICSLVVFAIAIIGSAAAQVTVSSPANGATVSSPVQFVASAASSNSAYPITAMRIYVDSNSAYTVNASSLSTSLTLTDGAHGVVFVAWDASGQAYTKGISINVGSASAMPGVTITSPASGAAVSSPVRFAASATSSNSAYPITAMRIYVDNNSAYTVNASSLSTSLSLSNGPHNVVVVAWDASGNSYTNTVNLTVGTTPVSGKITIASPANGSSTSSPVQFAASATANAGSAITAMRIYVDNTSAYTVYAASLNTSLSLGSGSHNIIVQAWDNTGAVYKAAEIINVSAVTVDPPTSHTATLNWTASTSGGIAGYNIYRGTQSGGPYTKVISSPQAGTSYTDSSVASGTTYEYVVTAVNGAGQESGYSGQATAVIP